MFGISFGQIFLILVIGLIVLGPEKLPVAIRTVTSWIRALRSLSASVQLELSKELQLQELQESLKQAEQSGLNKISPEIQRSIDNLKLATQKMQQAYEQDMRNVLLQQPTQSTKDATEATAKEEQPDEKSPS